MESKTDRLELQKLIEDRIAKLEVDIERIRKLTKPVAPDNSIGRLTRMEAIQEKNMHQAHLRSSELTLKKLQNCLTRINRDSFGTCRECGSDIPMDRLRLVPFTFYCTECAEIA